MLKISKEYRLINILAVTSTYDYVCIRGSPTDSLYVKKLSYRAPCGKKWAPIDTLYSPQINIYPICKKLWSQLRYTTPKWHQKLHIKGCSEPKRDEQLVEWNWGRLLQRRWASTSRIHSRRRQIGEIWSAMDKFFRPFYSMLYTLGIFVTNV
jgi:hypothetical protein